MVNRSRKIGSKNTVSKLSRKYDIDNIEFKQNLLKFDRLCDQMISNVDYLYIILKNNGEALQQNIRIHDKQQDRGYGHNALRGTQG